MKGPSVLPEKHIFCLECSNQTFGTALICPACDSALIEEEDIVLTNLNPKEEFKSSVLAGLRPESIIEISRRALCFWSYQKTQEALFHESSLTDLNARYSDLERQIHMIRNVANHEIQVTSLQEEQARSVKKYQDLNEQLQDKNRQFAKLQQLYDKLKQRTMQTQMVNLSQNSNSLKPISTNSLIFDTMKSSQERSYENIRPSQERNYDSVKSSQERGGRNTSMRLPTVDAQRADSQKPSFLSKPHRLF
ncbi:hypothetical protein HDU67_006995 [Dinochytrium kinnereticum]|nr:hypothetical protein HDU67_006995 [Dinochytrium kinnereticum]